MLDNLEIELILKNAKASLSFEDMPVDDDLVDLARKYLQGKLTEEEVLNIIKTKALEKNILWRGQLSSGGFWLKFIT